MIVNFLTGFIPFVAGIYNWIHFLLVVVAFLVDPYTLEK